MCHKPLWCRVLTATTAVATVCFAPLVLNWAAVAVVVVSPARVPESEEREDLVIVFQGRVSAATTGSSP